MTKRDANVLKGIAIILMLMHHLFSFPNRFNGYTYVHFFKEFPLFESYIGNFGKICISIFLFISGYAMMLNSEKLNFKIILRKIKKVYINYIVIAIIFFPFIIFRRHHLNSFKELLLNFLGISSTFVGEWWYIRVYLLLLLLSYLFLKRIKKYLYQTLLFSVIIWGVGIYLAIQLKQKEILDIELIRTLKDICICQISYIIGMLSDKIELKVQSNLIYKICYILYSIVFIILRFKYLQLYILDWSVILFLINLLIKFINLKKIIITILDDILEKIGKESFYIWLIHPIFCYQLYMKEIYSAKYSILILIWLLFLSYITSKFLSKLRI